MAKESFVPYSVYLSLISPYEASIAFEGGDFVLTIRGGDASWSYFVRVYFDKTHVYRTEKYSSLWPEPTEDTTYWIRGPSKK